MKNKPVLVFSIILFIFISSVIAASPIDPLSRTDKLIRDSHKDTQEYCKETCEAKALEFGETYKEELNTFKAHINQIVWFDRVMTALGVFVVVLLANSFSQFLYRRNLRKYEILQAKLKGWREYEAQQRERRNKKDLGLP